MDSFQAEIEWRTMRERENKKYSSVTFLSDAQQKILKKSKIIEKIKKYHYCFIQAKIDWKRLRKRENKNYPSVPFLPEALEKILKKRKKNSKN